MATIELDDGLPQTICMECVNIINTAIEFRNQSHRSERKLLRRGHTRKMVYKMDSAEKTFTKYLLIETEPNVKRENIHSHFSDIFDGDSCADSTQEDVCPTNFEEACWNSEQLELNQEHVALKLAKDGFENPKKTKVDRKKRYEKLIDGPMGGPGPYECKACKKILKSWSSFRTHAKIHLGFDFMCEFCGKKFIAVTMLQRHCMSQHGTERTYRCQLCDHRALDSERLKIHVRREHTGDRPYVCDSCGASFLTRRNLVHHLAVHVTQRTVQCAKCPAKFKSTQHLACHTSKVHRLRAWRAQCYLCENSYTKHENVRKHLAKVHGVPRQHQAAIRRVRAALDA